MDELKIKGRITYILWVIFWAYIFTLTSLYISSHNFNADLFDMYLKNKEILWLNYVPIFFSTLGIGYIVGSFRTSVIFNGIFWNVLAYIHSLKVLYRQEPLKVSDYQFLREAFIMAKKYSLEITWQTIGIVLIALLILWFGTKPLRVTKIYERLGVRFIGALLVFTLFYSFTTNTIFAYSTYMRLGEESGLNIWQELNGFESKGFSYPFMFTFASSRGYVYEEYDKNNALAIDQKYKDHDIPSGQKINFMTIMLESYKDFYKFRNDKLIFNENPYEYFYELANDSIHGSLIVNTFGGGTFVTESCYWSGYRDRPSFSVPRNTYISYFNDQGYRTEAFHPSDGLFNNRHNIYPNVGFDDFYYFQNYFSRFKEDISPDGDILPDATFFPRLMEKYHEGIAKGDPYFSWSITYQGHGPYPDDYFVRGKEYVQWQDHYDKEQWYSFNNYLDGVADTSEQLRYVVNELREGPPVILTIFGDHSPSMGDNAVGMSMCGIENDLSTVDGMINTYETPYIIWANPAAREVLGKEMVGEGPPLDPNFLMAEVFEQIGWKGPKYTGFIQDFIKDITVTKPSLWFEHGEYKKELSEDGKRKFKDLKDYEYFISTKKRIEKKK
ncbi:MAG: LTA synthase family protein [Tissierellia bacterium]|nr:LTA synthase family protein [Tissierellia bacterium]